MSIPRFVPCVMRPLVACLSLAFVATLAQAQAQAQARTRDDERRRRRDSRESRLLRPGRCGAGVGSAATAGLLVAAGLAVAATTALVHDLLEDERRDQRGEASEQ